MTAAPLLLAPQQAAPTDAAGRRVKERSKAESATDGNVPFKRQVSLHERQLAAVIAIALVLSAIVLTPLCNLALVPVPGFVACYATASIIISLLLAALLFCKAKIEQQQADGRLAVAYLFAGMIVVLHLVSFPGALMKGKLLGGPGSPTWLWIFWHVGFALLIVYYALRKDRGPASPNLLKATLSTAALAGGLGYIGLFQIHRLPPIMIDESLWGGFYGVAPSSSFSRSACSAWACCSSNAGCAPRATSGSRSGCSVRFLTSGCRR